MEFRDVVLNRRSCRSYEDRPVSDKDLEEIIEAGLYAPSAVDLQPWFFVVVKSPEEMKKVHRVMGQVAEDCTPHLKERFAMFPKVADDSIRFISMLGGAPVVVLAFLNSPKLTGADTPMVESVSAAIENMLLAATDKGIGSCWLTAPLRNPDNAEKLREAFAPDKGELMALITLGYPSKPSGTPKRKSGRYVIV